VLLVGTPLDHFEASSQPPEPLKVHVVLTAPAMLAKTGTRIAPNMQADDGLQIIGHIPSRFANSGRKPSRGIRLSFDLKAIIDAARMPGGAG
jgi:hypothetical protein